MDLALGHSPWVLAVSLVVAAGLSYWTYRRTTPSLSAGWRGLLGGLRFLALALILFLLIEPVLRQLSTTEQPPLLAVVLDDSESMQVVTGGPDTSSAATARSALRSFLPSALDEVTGGPVRHFGFNRTLRGLSASPLDSLTFGGGRTNIGRALNRLPAQVEGDNLGGVLLVSDGQHNTGRTPLRIADRYPVPIHTVTVGDTTRRRDLRVRRVSTNEVAYTDSEVPVRATLQAERLDATTVTATLSRGDSLLDETEVRLPDGTAEVPVDFSFEARRPGQAQLTVSTSSVPGEATTRNNARTTSLRILDRRRRVLLLGAAPSPSFTAVRRVLTQNADTRLVSRVPRQDGAFYGGPLPDTLSRFDVIVSVGFPSDAVAPSAVQAVAQALSDGTPGVFFLDRQTDLAAWRNQFGSVLPATPAEASLRTTAAPASLTTAGRQHPIFRVDEAARRLIGDLPLLQVPTSAWTPSPDAEVLATARRSSSDGDAPLLVVRRRADRRSALFLGTGAWRWKTLPPSLRAADPLWPGLVSNMVRWAATQAQERQVQVRPVAVQFDGDEGVAFTGQVYDESMAPIASANVEVTITDSTGTARSYTMSPARQGQYRLEVGTLPAGDYQFRAVARQNGATLGRDRGEFSVGALQIEYQAARADPVLMQQIAARSGGTAYRPSSLDRLPSALSQTTAFSPSTRTEATRLELWRQWPLLVLVLLLLVAEWTLRRRFGLT